MKTKSNNNFFLKLKLHCKKNKIPKFAITINGILQNYIEENNYIIVTTSLCLGNHLLNVKFINKTPEDTVVDANGKIVEDLAIEITECYIDDIDFSHNIKEYGKYYVNKKIEKTYGFLFANGIFEYEFQRPGFLFLRNINLIK